MDTGLDANSDIKINTVPDLPGEVVPKIVQLPEPESENQNMNESKVKCEV